MEERETYCCSLRIVHSNVLEFCITIEYYQLNAATRARHNLVFEICLPEVSSSVFVGVAIVSNVPVREKYVERHGCLEWR